MMQGVRFWPPDSPLTESIRWALQRAFGTVSRDSPFIAAPTLALEFAERMGLLPRIFARQPQCALKAEVGETFERATARVHALAARGLALERALHKVDAAASSVGVRYALIKGAAVVRHLGSNLALRGACDIDLLLTEPDAIRLDRELKKRGYRQKSPSHPEFHMPTLVDGQYNAVELHTRLPCIALCSAKQWVELEDMIAAREVTSVTSGLLCALLPSHEFLLAHCLAHGIAQHGYAPRSYQLLRLLADIVDLSSLPPSPDFTRIGSWLSASVSPDEINGVLELRNELTDGNVRQVWQRRDGTGRLLRHLVLANLDHEYANALTPFGAVQLLRSGGVRRFMREYGHATFGLANEDLARIYGSGSARRNLALKLMRPFDVVHRIAKMIPGASAILVRRFMSSPRLVV